MKNNKIKIIALFSAVFFLTTASVAFADDPIPPDITPPVITVLGDGSVSVTQNSAYIDTGATAADDIDGDITAQILTVNPVNVSIPGTYTVTYNVSDIAGNTAVQVARAVTVTPLTATVHLTVVTDTQVLYDSDETVSSCESSPNSGIFTVSGYCAVIQSGLANDWTWYGTDGFLNSLGGVANDFSNNMYMYWGWFGDLTYGETSLNAHTVTQGEHLLLNYNINPLKLTVSNSSPAQHDTVTFTLLQFGLDSNFNPVWIPATGGSVAINGISQTVGDDGTYSATVDSTDPYIISGNKTGFINSDTITLNPTAVTVNETVLIHLTVVTDTQVLYDSDETVSSCESSPNSGIFTVSGYCAVIQSGLANDWTWYGTDGFLNSLGGVANDFSNNMYMYWGWFGDLTYGETSLNAHTVTQGEHLLLNYNINPLKLTVSNSSPAQHDTVTFTLLQFGLDSNFNPVWIPATGGSVAINGISQTVGDDGTYSATVDSTDPYIISGNKTGFINSDTITLNPTAVTVNETVLIRNGDTIIYQGIIPLPTAGTVSITDNAGNAHLVNADSVLGILYSISQTNTEFSLSNLQYYISFNSLYLKCLTPEGSAPLCDNWQYVVNNNTPTTGMDLTLLSGGENIVLYFGNPHQIIFDKTTVNVNESFTATAQKYNYLDNTWGPLLEVTIGASQPNPNDPFNPTIITSAKVDVNGSVTLIISNAGTYDVGIAEDFYFPSYAVTVNAADSGGGGGGGETITPPVFSVQNALNYLASVQSADGSFAGSSLYTDWAGIAIGAAGESGIIRTNILLYMNARNSIDSLLTENERRAIALLSLGQNPYSFNGTNYISAITNTFDGAQFGDSSLTNDDIFALIPLASAGYTANDEIITKDITFILGKQLSNGSWENSVDLTAAAVQALYPFNSTPGVSSALATAGPYLQNAQGNDGGWGNISSSSWAGQAMNVLGAEWTKNGKTILDYLSTQQATDGAALAPSETLQNRIWATSYAIPAALGKPWNLIMQPVSKPIAAPSGGGGGGSGGGSAGNNNTPATNPAATTADSDTISQNLPESLPVNPTALQKTEEVKITVLPPAAINTQNPEPEPKIKTPAVATNVNTQTTQSPLQTDKTDTLIENNLAAALGNKGNSALVIPLVLSSGAFLSLMYFVARRFFE